MSRVRERRLHREAKRRGLLLVKSRERDPRSSDYGTYGIVDRATKVVVASDGRTSFGLSLDEVERWLDNTR